MTESPFCATGNSWFAIPELVEREFDATKGSNAQKVNNATIQEKITKESLHWTLTHKTT